MLYFQFQTINYIFFRKLAPEFTPQKLPGKRKSQPVFHDENEPARAKVFTFHHTWNWLTYVQYMFKWWSFTLYKSPLLCDTTHWTKRGLLQPSWCEKIRNPTNCRTVRKILWRLKVRQFFCWIYIHVFHCCSVNIANYYVKLYDFFLDMKKQRVTSLGVLPPQHG